MGKEFSQKIKLLKLYELLQMESDEEKPLTAYEICEKLMKKGIPCDRRTLTRDIRVLEQYGYEVMSVMIGHEKAYYIDDRSFSLAEIKILIDAVQASSFITEKKTEQLIDKLSYLGGAYKRDILKSNIVRFNTRKHKNESIYYNADSIEKAIRQNRTITFRYFDLDENCRKVYRKGGDEYIAEPVALIFNEDNYYLMAYSAHYENTANYRVDRMDCVNITEQPISKAALSKRKEIHKYTKRTFKMFNGDTKRITLQFDRQLIGAVFDKFGEDTLICRIDEYTASCEVDINISPAFWGWLFQFGSKMKISAPKAMVKEYNDRIEELKQTKKNLRYRRLNARLCYRQSRRFE